MASFTDGQVLALTLDYDDYITFSGKGVATVTPSGGSTYTTNLTGTQTIGPFKVGSTSVSIACIGVGTYTQASTTVGPVPTYSLAPDGTPTGLVGPGGGVLPTSSGSPLGKYLGQISGKQGAASKTYRGAFGRKVASWTNALQNSAGTAALVSGDLPPFADNSTKVLQLTQNATVSFGQYNPLDGGQGYFPSSLTVAPNMGVWVKNPNTRTLNFELRLYNAAANHTLTWNCAIEPTGNNWQFMTMSSTQGVAGGGWVFGTDLIAYVRITQKDNGPIGAWAAGEYLKFGNVYADVKARPRFLIGFDDGYSNVNTPNNTILASSGVSYVSSTLTNTLTTAAVHNLTIGAPIRFIDTAPTSLTVGTTYYVQTVPSTTTFTLATDQFTLVTTATTTGFAGTANWQYAGSQGRSGQQIVEEYGFRGNLFIVPGWLGSSGKYGYGASPSTFMSASDVQTMYAAGWSVGSHSNTHPSNNENAGLRLLGPYGYFLSNTVDNLPASYVSAWSLGASNRRRITAGTQASPSVFTAENAHQFLINQPIVFTDVAPTGCTLGVTYYVASLPSSTTFTLATDQGTLASTVNNTTGAWSGTANYRHPGSSNDSSAIYADIAAGIAGVTALGIPTGAKFFALPQGAADVYVRAACIQAALVWVRGIGSTVNTINVGLPTGGGLSGLVDYSGGWMAQQDAVQTDGATAVPFATIKSYIDTTTSIGACGCSYHHSTGFTTIANLDQMCAYLRTKVDANQIDVLTCDELAALVGF